MDKILDILADAGLDTLKMLPFLFGVFLLMEFLEHKYSEKLPKLLEKNGRFGIFGGAFLGCIPQCGFSVAASNLYAGRLISAGTLIAVYVSTSDEAVPILISHPEKIGLIWKVLLVKVIAAIAAGFIVDLIIKLVGLNKNTQEEQFTEICDHCDCDHGILRSALKHTLSTVIFILVVNIILNSVITVVGERTLSDFLGSIKFLQPIIAGVIGLIPNCAASVILTELYVDGRITFGSMIAGLSTGAGLGVVMLFKSNKHFKTNFMILGTLLIIGIATGFIVDILPIAW